MSKEIKEDETLEHKAWKQNMEDTNLSEDTSIVVNNSRITVDWIRTWMNGPEWVNNLTSEWLSNLQDGGMTEITEQYLDSKIKEIIKELKSIDENTAIGFIIKKLLYKDSSDEHFTTIKACIKYMFEKHWTLYAKSLAKYNWAFIFYEAIWWVVWDERYITYKKNAEAQWLDVSEEELLEAVFKYGLEISEEEKQVLAKKYSDILTKQWHFN